MSKIGTYIVILKSQQARTIQIGKLAQLNIKAGYYLYIGSAMGAGGVSARLKHHRKISKRPHWHLDYLRAETTFEEAYVLYSAEKKECEWVRIMATTEVVCEPMKGFGSSDCRCRTHLFYFSSKREAIKAIETINEAQKIKL